MVVVGAARLDVHRASGLDREPLQGVWEQRDREPADPLTREGELDLGVRPPDEVDGGGGTRLVHRHDRGAVARHALTTAEGLLQGAPERRQDVLDRVVLVDVEISTRDALEVEPRVECEQREQMVEKPDPREGLSSGRFRRDRA